MSQHTAAPLGRLERVDPRKIWESEPYNFTPWLAEPDSLVLLGETLEIDLELEAQERPVGPYRADILCKDVGSNRWVLIENQLEKTDHIHLGQLLTYAAGLDAVTIVWISPRFTDEHRAALDWLNRITAEGVDFFGVELEVWRIGESAMAPRFTLVSKPNHWSKAVATGAQALVGGETAQLYLRYWTAFREMLLERGGSVKPTKPFPGTYMTMSPFGRAGFELVAWCNKGQRRVAASLYIKGSNANGLYRALKERRAEFEEELGPLTWSESAKKDRQVLLYLDDAEPADETQWTHQHAWLCHALGSFAVAFGPAIKTLQPLASHADGSEPSEEGPELGSEGGISLLE